MTGFVARSDAVAMRREGTQCRDGLANDCPQLGGVWSVSPGVEQDCHREVIHRRGLAGEARIEQPRDRLRARAAERIEVRHGADDPPGDLGPQTVPANDRSRRVEDDSQNCAVDDTRRDEPSHRVVLHLIRVRARAGNCML